MADSEPEYYSDDEAGSDYDAEPEPNYDHEADMKFMVRLGDYLIGIVQKMYVGAIEKAAWFAMIAKSTMSNSFPNQINRDMVILELIYHFNMTIQHAGFLNFFRRKFGISNIYN